MIQIICQAANKPNMGNSDHQTSCGDNMAHNTITSRYRNTLEWLVWIYIICIEGKINYWYHILVFISSPNSTASLSAIGINQNIKQKKDTFDQTIEIFKEDKTCIKEESYIGGTHPILMVNNTAPSESKNEIEVASNEEKQVTNVSAVQFQCI